MSHITERPVGREHFPIYPKGFVAVRIIQLVLGIICLGLSAYIVSIIPINGAVLVLFTSIVTLISSVYILVAHFGPPAAYNYWAILGLDIFHVIFWLISFALLASQAAAVLSYTDYYGFYDDAYTAYGSIAAAAAGVGAVNWVVYVVALVLHSIALHRHRQAGLHAMPGKSATAPETTVPPVAAVDVQMQPQQPQNYYQPQQAHEVAYQQQQQQQHQPPQPVEQQQTYQQHNY
ncbi:hypothetical protein F5Y03DRAFT_389658 [Xylaria venustula]|nr:hypothetical protein F5Y03DRAFT_389658 [Xylaria venustula]